MRAQAPVRVGRNGRIVIPAPLRRRLGIREGSMLVASADESGRLVLESRDAKWGHLRDRFSAARPPGSAVDALIAERRAEAAREG